MERVWHSSFWTLLDEVAVIGLPGSSSSHNSAICSIDSIVSVDKSLFDYISDTYLKVG